MPYSPMPEHTLAPVRAFLASHCIIDPDAETPFLLLYSKFSASSSTHLSEPHFSRALSTLVPNLSRARRGSQGAQFKTIRGLQLRL